MNATTTDSVAMSISSLLALLTPDPSIASSLTGIPSSILSQLKGPEANSVYLQNVDADAPWVGSLSEFAYEWLTSQDAAAATIVPQVLSLQSVQLSKAMSSLSAATHSDPKTISSIPTSTFTTVITWDTLLPVETVFMGQVPGPDDDDGLSNGAKIAIGVAVPIVVIMAATIIFLCVIIRRNRFRGRNAMLFERAVPTTSPGPYDPFPDDRTSTNGSTTIRGNGNGNENEDEDDNNIEVVEVVDENGNVVEYIANHVNQIAEPIDHHDWTTANGFTHHLRSSGTQHDYPSILRRSQQSLSSQPTVTNRLSSGSTIKRKPVGSDSSQSRQVQSVDGITTCEHVPQTTRTPRLSMTESNYEDALSNTDPTEMTGAILPNGHRSVDDDEGTDAEDDADTIVGEKLGTEHTNAVRDGEKRETHETETQVL